MEMFVSLMRVFLAASWMPGHTKAWKFKRPLLQNKEPLQTEELFKWIYLAAVIPHESRNSEEKIIP